MLISNQNLSLISTDTARETRRRVVDVEQQQQNAGGFVDQAVFESDDEAPLRVIEASNIDAGFFERQSSFDDLPLNEQRAISSYQFSESIRPISAPLNEGAELIVGVDTFA